LALREANNIPIFLNANETPPFAKSTLTVANKRVDYHSEQKRKSNIICKQKEEKVESFESPHYP
jgi:hypothetical protein